MPDILYITSPTDYSIKRLASKSTVSVQTDKQLRWADMVSNRPDGRIYTTASHIQDTQWSTPGTPPSIRAKLFSFALVK